MSQTEKPTAAFALSLLAGIFMLINATILWLGGSLVAGIEAVPGIASALIYAGIAGAVISGAIVLLGAFMLYRNPAQKTLWGTIILVLSILSIIRLDIISSILGIIGGALALTWKPKPPTTPAPTAP